MKLFIFAVLVLVGFINCDLHFPEIEEPEVLVPHLPFDKHQLVRINFRTFTKVVNVFGDSESFELESVHTDYIAKNNKLVLLQAKVVSSNLPGESLGDNFQKYLVDVDSETPRRFNWYLKQGVRGCETDFFAEPREMPLHVQVNLLIQENRDAFEYVGTIETSEDTIYRWVYHDPDYTIRVQAKLVEDEFLFTQFELENPMVHIYSTEIDWSFSDEIPARLFKTPSECISKASLY